MQTDQLLAGVVILSLLGLAVVRLINLLETRYCTGGDSFSSWPGQARA